MRQIAPQDAADARSHRDPRMAGLARLRPQAQAARRGPRELLRELEVHARRSGVKLPFTANTPYVNTIPVEEQTPVPGSNEIERRIKSLVRWNAMAMVVKANRRVRRHRRPHLDLRLVGDALRGRASTTSSAARSTSQGGDLVYFQGHASPGMYARAFLEGRLSTSSSSRTSAAS